MITHQFNTEQQILEVVYQDVVSADEIMAFMAFLSGDNAFPRELKILVDARGVNYNFNLGNIDKLMESTVQCVKYYTTFKVALIHSKPKETAFSHLLEIEKTPANHVHKVFFTKEAALEWLKDLS